jgi:hypothetical protein
MKYDELMRFLGFSPEGTENFDVKVMHYGELFDVREIATANRKDAKHLGLKPGQPYLVIS